MVEPLHDSRTCPVCSDSIRRAPYRTKDRRGVVIEHPEPLASGGRIAPGGVTIVGQGGPDYIIPIRKGEDDGLPR
jgi:hypothetical protein